MRAIPSLAELKKLVGQEVAVSEWVPITQERVNLFAEATGDRQWIHIDVDRCRTESPYGGTIAHGFLTLSLLPVLMQNAIQMPAAGMVVNYGLNKVRFMGPVPVGSKVRGRMQLLSADDLTDGTQLTWQVTVEREGSDKPVCVAESITRRYG